jgi:hypothetical protein
VLAHSFRFRHDGLVAEADERAGAGAIGHGVAVRQRFSAFGRCARLSRRRSTVTIGGGRSRRRPKPEPAQAAVHVDHRYFADPVRRAQGGRSR